MLTVGKVLVLGDPAYYGRFGFAKETAIQPPYPLPEAWDGAWQSLVLNQNVETQRAYSRCRSRGRNANCGWAERHSKAAAEKLELLARGF
jgi:hypothetical protein